MSSPNDNHSLIVDYLLGRLSETELDRFERDYLTNENLFNELQEVEEELIDDYASGALTADQRVSFEKYFLRSSQRQEKLAFATAITERARAWQSGTLVSTERPPRDLTSVELSDRSNSKLHSVFWKGSVPAWRQWVAIAAAVVLAVIIGVLWLRNRELQRQLIATNANYARLRQEADAQSKITAETKAELSAEQQQTQMLESQVEQLQTSPPDDIRDTIVNLLLGLDYLVGITRGGEKKVRTLDVPPKARLVRLTLDVPASSFESFNILLRRGEKNLVWRRSGLKARPAGDRRKLSLSVPAEHLTAGDYELLLSGVPSEGDAELVGRYYLKVQRR
jgi:negative regulator of sigma E activity